MYVGANILTIFSTRLIQLVFVRKSAQTFIFYLQKLYNDVFTTQATPAANFSYEFGYKLHYSTTVGDE